MNKIEELKKEIERLKPYVDYYGQIPTLTKDNTKEFIRYCECKAELKGRQDALKEVLSFIESQRDNGNTLANEKGFSGAICLSELMKKLKKELKQGDKE